LKENVVVLELETERLKAKLAAAEVNLDVERDLLKSKGIKERDLDSELGSGRVKSHRSIAKHIWIDFNECKVLSF
jgi:hypothetical protein